MLDFQATDAVGMRVQSVAKIDGEPSRADHRLVERVLERNTVDVTVRSRRCNFSNCHKDEEPITAVVLNSARSYDSTDESLDFSFGI